MNQFKDWHPTSVDALLWSNCNTHYQSASYRLPCGLIATELWRYIDPDDGMQEEEFQEGCSEFCYAFICPDCEHYKRRECTQDKPYCLDKITDILKENELVKEKGKYSYQIWKLVPREVRNRVKKYSAFDELPCE